jgi:cellulose 1,4-beta-cellobiosidase
MDSDGQQEAVCKLARPINSNLEKRLENTMRIRWMPKPLLATIFMLWLAGGTLSAFAQQHVSNPFVGAVQYANPDYAKELQALASTTTDSVLKAQLNVIATYSTGIWMDRIAAIAGSSATGGRLGLQEQLDNAVLIQQSAGKPVVIPIVIYDLPDRDCAARASNGELSIAANPPTQPLDGLTTYETQYIDVIAGILKNPKYVNLRFVLVIEPDSLPNLVTNTGKSFTIANCQLAQSSGVYVAGVQHAINAFHPIPNAYLYLDIGHSAWLGWPDNAAAAVTLFTTVVSGATGGLGSIDGFIDDTANYTPVKEPFIDASQTFNGTQVISATFYSFNHTVDEAGYATELQTLFRANGWPVTSTNFITDTSRNGWGGPNRPQAASSSTDVNTFVNASRIDRRGHRGLWCNQSGAGLGIPPLAAPPDFPQFQAYVWIKPPGESDGTYPGSANQMGAIHADPNCDPAQTNPLAGNTATGSIANSPPAGQFFVAELIQNIQNAFPVVPSDPGPSFTVFGSPVSVMQGATATTSVTVLPVNNFSGAVTLAISGLPTGVTANFSPASIANGSGISTVTLTAAANAPATTPPSATPVTVTATSGAISKVTTFNVTVIGRPDFSVSATPASISIAAGTNPTSTITVASLFGFTGSISLSASGLPTGVNANFSPSSINGSGTIVVNFTAQTSTPTGTTNISIVGTSGAVVHTATIALTVTGPDFTLSANPTSLTVAQGKSASSTITVTTGGGFNSNVALSAGGLPTGVTASFAGNVVTFAASNTATTGIATVTITGTGGGLTRTTTISLGVTNGQPDFSLSANPPSVSVAQGGTATSTLTVTPVSGFNGAVTFSASGLPNGVTATFAGNVVTFTAATNAATGPASVTITGTSGALSHTVVIALTVTGTGGDFALSAAPATVTVNQGSMATSVITVTPSNGFAGSVALTVSGLPSGVTASFSPASTTGTSTLTLSASSTATLGAATVTVTGTSGTLTHTATIALTVTPVQVGNGGVTVGTVINSNSAFFNDQGVKLANTGAITALSVTITVKATPGVTFNGQYNTVGGSILQSHSSTASTITYQFNLAAGQTLSPGNWLFDAQMGGTGTLHPTSGDVFTVTYTTGGSSFTQSGHF